MSYKRKKIGQRYWCGNCYREGYHAKCGICGKPCDEVKDKHSKTK